MKSLWETDRLVHYLEDLYIKMMKKKLGYSLAIQHFELRKLSDLDRNNTLEHILPQVSGKNFQHLGLLNI